MQTHTLCSVSQVFGNGTHFCSLHRYIYMFGISLLMRRSNFKGFHLALYSKVALTVGSASCWMYVISPLYSNSNYCMGSELTRPMVGWTNSCKPTKSTWWQSESSGLSVSEELISPEKGRYFFFLRIQLTWSMIIITFWGRLRVKNYAIYLLHYHRVLSH